jgi:hypothetical protein
MQIINLNLFTMNLQELSKEEQMAIFGGNEASDAIWSAIGFTLHAIGAFFEGAKSGGYAQCKCP